VQDAPAAVKVTIEVGTRQLRSLNGPRKEEERLDSVNAYCDSPPEELMIAGTQ
jgi:hypothetical protein